eukprot:39904-Eustigmatos_ZCMA.PRE.1
MAKSALKCSSSSLDFPIPRQAVTTTRIHDGVNTIPTRRFYVGTLHTENLRILDQQRQARDK